MKESAMSKEIRVRTKRMATSSAVKVCLGKGPEGLNGGEDS